MSNISIAYVDVQQYMKQNILILMKLVQMMLKNLLRLDSQVGLKLNMWRILCFKNISTSFFVVSYIMILQLGNQQLSFKIGEKELPDFQYNVHVGPDGLPDAIMFMTAAMRKNLICYGLMMFLDAKMRAFNQLCWPYI